MNLLFKIEESPVTYAYSDSNNNVVIVTEDLSFTKEAFKQLIIKICWKIWIFQESIR